MSDMENKQDNNSEEPKIVGYLSKNNEIRGPGFAEWVEPVYDKPPPTLEKNEKRNIFTI